MDRLRPFGIQEQGNSLIIDKDIAANKVSCILQNYFRYEPSPLVLFELGNPKSDKTAERLFMLKGLPQEDAELAVDKAVVSEKTFTLYIGHLPHDLANYPEFAVFLGEQLSLSTITDLGEEILHGEHISHYVKEGNMKAENPYDSFSELSLEFLGYAGRVLVSKETGIPLEQINFKEIYDVGHDLAYGAVESIGDKLLSIPLHELFYAKTEEEFWKVVGRSFPDGINIVLSIRSNSDIDLMEEILRPVINEHAQKIFNIYVFSISEDETSRLRLD